MDRLLRYSECRKTVTGLSSGTCSLFTDKNLVVVLRVKRLEDLGDTVLDKVVLGHFVTAKGDLSTVCWESGKKKDFTDHGPQP